MLIRDSGGPWREPEDFGYPDEATLQAILLERPNLVPGITGQAIAVHEFESGIGPADIVILDAEATITVVECKLASNRQIRREVMGQVLDYASRLWRMSVETFEAKWRAAQPARLSPFDQLDDSDGRIRAQVAENLASGRFDLVLAVDAINEDLRRMVEYLNTVTEATTTVVLVEFQRLRDGDLEILIPTEYGRQVVPAANVMREARHDWTKQEYVEWCREHDPESTEKIEGFIAALESSGFEVYGGRAATPSLNILLRIPGLGRKFPICMYTSAARGAIIEIRFSDFKNHGRAMLDAFAAVACALKPVPLTLEELRQAEYRKRPNIEARLFSHEELRALAEGIAHVADSTPQLLAGQGKPAPR